MNDTGSDDPLADIGDDGAGQARSAGCARVRPLLFAALEGLVDRDESIAIHAHLAHCVACRSFERGERALGDLLAAAAPHPAHPPAHPPARPRPWRRALAAAAGLAAVCTVALLLTAAAPHGSVVERRLGPGMGWDVRAEHRLARTNHVDVPPAGSVAIALASGPRLESTGPSCFELDLLGGEWQLVVLEGHVRAHTGPGGLVVVHRTGRWRLPQGWHLVTVHDVVREAAPPPETAALAESAPQDPQDPPQAQDPQRDPAGHIAEGQRHFVAATPAAHGGDPARERAAMAAAEKHFRAALADPRIDAAQRNTAMFYLAASLGRQERHRESMEVQREWLRLHPDDRSRGYVLFFLAVNHERLGEADEAQRIRRLLIEEEPDSDMARHARAYLEGAVGAAGSGGGGGAAAAAGGTQPDPGRVTVPPRQPGPAGGGGYLVVAVDLDAGREADGGWLAAARAAAEFHGAAVEPWDGDDAERLRALLRAHRPADVLFVLRPELLDVVRHRRILLESAAVDDDWFTDFAFGYLTAATGAGAGRLWQRIAARHERGTTAGRWVRTGVSPAARSVEQRGAPPALAAAAGYDGTLYRFGIDDPARDEVIDRALADFRKADVIQMTGNGDPQGIWLFSDRHNLDAARHWDYAPGRVGHDPGGEMPRLLAARFSDLGMDAPVVWSGTCHSGATCRVFVEGDIVSTFGRTQVATVHRLRPEESLALALLEGGAAALLVPIASNHGMSTLMEADFALRHGASLGAVLRSTWDDVLLAAQGRLVLDLPRAGERHGGREDVMQGGGANRILIGDPRLRPFPRVDSPSETVRTERTARGCRVVVDRAAGFEARGWDMYGRSAPDDWRVLVRVDLDAVGLAGEGGLEIEVEARAPDGAPMPYRLRRSALEEDHGRRWLHLQANGPRSAVERKAVQVVFRIVRVER